MQQGRVVIVDNSIYVQEAMKNALVSNEGIEVVGTADNGALALDILRNEQVDVIVTDLVLPCLDGLSLIEEISNQVFLNKPKIIVLTALISDALIRRTMSFGVNYYMLKPFEPAVVCQRVVELLHTQNILVPGMEIKNKKHCFDEQLFNILLTIGIPAHIKGYHFLREAIKRVIDNPDLINALTKELYPTVALRFNTSATRVERAIRHAIDVAWNKDQIGNINKLLESDVYVQNRKPTNGELIALIADRFILEKTA
ncbi:MAG: sporulation transcription factor Spo0A [Syntrophomonadaceae bacterium]|jgi:two-component system response regulator (stage 0 sporulation protein A)|nr:sporulation transcription factor Spo0A [Syntrophomonadaceae bacterium]